MHNMHSSQKEESTFYRRSSGPTPLFFEVVESLTGFQTVLPQFGLILIAMLLLHVGHIDGTEQQVQQMDGVQACGFEGLAAGTTVGDNVVRVKVSHTAGINPIIEFRGWRSRPCLPTP